MKPADEVRTAGLPAGEHDVEAAVRRHPLFRAANEVVLRLGWTALGLYAVIFTVFIMRHAPQILDAEVRALQLLSAAFETVP